MTVHVVYYERGGRLKKKLMKLSWYDLTVHIPNFGLFSIRTMSYCMTCSSPQLGVPPQSPDLNRFEDLLLHPMHPCGSNVLCALCVRGRRVYYVNDRKVREWSEWEPRATSSSWLRASSSPSRRCFNFPFFGNISDSDVNTDGLTSFQTHQKSLNSLRSLGVHQYSYDSLSSS